MIFLTDRPPQLETPIRYFRQDLTPNEAFFVRWHLEGIPTSVDLRTFRLNVSGHVRQPLQLSVDDLRSQFEPISIIAVNQCSGNSRSFFHPRVPGGQWKHGACGNAKWTGVSMKSILDRAQVKAGAVDLVVPGWYGTYWVKAVSDITVLPQPFSNFWTDKAYRIPKGPNGTESPKDLAKDTIPIDKFNVRSIFVRPESGMPESRMKLRASRLIQVTGFDEWRCRPTGEPPSQMLDWIRKSESIRGAAGGRPGHQETAGSIDSWLGRQMRWEKLRARNNGTALVLCGM